VGYCLQVVATRHQVIAVLKMSIVCELTSCDNRIESLRQLCDKLARSSVTARDSVAINHAARLNIG
jgi:hypothetical protein